jgi:hypothetical protein
MADDLPTSAPTLRFHDDRMETLYGGDVEETFALSVP